MKHLNTENLQTSSKQEYTVSQKWYKLAQNKIKIKNDEIALELNWQLSCRSHWKSLPLLFFAFEMSNLSYVYLNTTVTITLCWSTHQFLVNDRHDAFLFKLLCLICSKNILIINAFCSEIYKNSCTRLIFKFHIFLEKCFQCNVVMSWFSFHFEPWFALLQYYDFWPYILD